MGRASKRSGPARARSRLDLACCLLCGSATVKKFYFRPGLARGHLYDSWAERPFSLFFNLKLPKKKNNVKHGLGPNRHEPRPPWTKFEICRLEPDPPLPKTRGPSPWIGRSMPKFVYYNGKKLVKLIKNMRILKTKKWNHFFKLQRWTCPKFVHLKTHFLFIPKISNNTLKVKQS